MQRNAEPLAVRDAKNAAVQEAINGSPLAGRELLDVILGSAREAHAEFPQYDGTFEPEAGWALARVREAVTTKGGLRFAKGDVVARLVTSRGWGLEREHTAYSVRGQIKVRVEPWATRAMEPTEPAATKFKVGDRVSSPYMAADWRGTIARVDEWQPPFEHGVTGDTVAGEHWYTVTGDDGVGEYLSDTRLRLRREAVQ